MLKQIIVISLVILVILAIAFFVYKNLSKNTKTEVVKNDVVIENPNTRVDIYHFGKNDYDFEVLNYTPSEMQILTFKNENWMHDPGTFKNFLLKSQQNWQKAEIQFKAKGEGTINIDFMGPYILDANGQPEKIYSDYRNAEIDGNKIFTDAKTLWHNERESHAFQAVDGQVYTLKFEYKLPEGK